MIGLIFALGLTLQESPITSDAYTACLDANIRRLELSQDAASDVARAVIISCMSLEAGAGSSGQVREARLAIRESFEGRVLLQIVRIRACRRTPGCSVSSLPDPYGRLQP